MIPLLLASLALALAGAAALTAAFTLRGEEAVQGWAVAGLGTLGLALAPSASDSSRAPSLSPAFWGA